MNWTNGNVRIAIFAGSMFHRRIEKFRQLSAVEVTFSVDVRSAH